MNFPLLPFFSVPPLSTSFSPFPIPLSFIILLVGTFTRLHASFAIKGLPIGLHRDRQNHIGSFEQATAG